MLMVIFGAGASYDVAPSVTGLPTEHLPLASELFDSCFNSILKDYEDIHSLILPGAARHWRVHRSKAQTRSRRSSTRMCRGRSLLPFVR